MKLVVAVRLFPGAPQEAALRDTLALCNRAANMVSARAFETRVTEKQSLQRLVYGDLKEMGLSAQPAIHVARKVAGAYVTLKASIRAGNLGEPGGREADHPGLRPPVPGQRPRSRSQTEAPVPGPARHVHRAMLPQAVSPVGLRAQYPLRGRRKELPVQRRPEVPLRPPA